MINNTPEIKLGIVAVSRDCFPNSLSENRRKAVVKAYDGEIYECPIIVENEIDMMNALEDLKKAKLKMFGIPLTKTMKKGLRKNKRHLMN